MFKQLITESTRKSVLVKSLTYIRSLTFCNLEIFFVPLWSQTIIKVMFKKSPKTKQFDMFSPSGLLCEREGRLYNDPSAWHNTFYRDVTSNIDEEIFKPLYTTENDGNRVGRPNVPIRILVAMIILKEVVGCSNEQLYEHCRFNLLYRRALGMVSLDEQCPTIDSYYGFRRKLCKHEEKFKENLFKRCFKQITKQT